MELFVYFRQCSASGLRVQEIEALNRPPQVCPLTAATVAVIQRVLSERSEETGVSARFVYCRISNRKRNIYEPRATSKVRLRTQRDSPIGIRSEFVDGFEGNVSVVL